ncbi:MAG: hypothetical protein ACI88H_002817 [Cocleimonas sp.]|jgi:hypothetical protein
MDKSVNGNCNKCRGGVDVYGSRFCADCYYPGIDDDWNEYQDLIADGHPRNQAAVLSGWLGAEEI